MKLYRISGYTQTHFAIYATTKNEYFMRTYDECKLCFDNIQDAIAYGFRYCYAQCFQIINLKNYKVVFRSSINEVDA